MLRALKYLLLIIIFLGIIYVGLGLYKFKNICYTYSGWSFRGIKGGDIDFDIFMKVKNTSHLPLGSSGYKVDIYIYTPSPGNLGKPKDLKPVVTIDSANDKSFTPFTLQPGEYTTLRLPVDVNIGNVLDAAKSSQIIADLLSKNYQNVMVNVTGTIKADLLGVTIKIPYNVIDITMSIKDIQDSANAPSQPC